MDINSKECQLMREKVLEQHRSSESLTGNYRVFGSMLKEC